MKDTKLEMITEGDIQSWKEEQNHPELEDKSEAELKYREEKRREKKNYKRGCASN